MDAKRKAGLQFLFGGLLPVVAFTVIEEKFGLLWGVVAGMVFCLGEMGWEWRRDGKVSPLTGGIALLILVLGGLSLWASDGIWFKLQPALVEGVFCLLLLGSLMVKKPLLLLVAERGGRVLPPPVKRLLPGLTFRMALFFGIHTALAGWAAFAWSTRSWALLKGLGFTLSFLAYMAVEVLLMRRRLRPST